MCLPVACETASINSRGRYRLLSFVLFVKVFVFCIDPEFDSFNSSFYCCIFQPVFQVNGRLSATIMFNPPHTLCACPELGTCSPTVVVIFYVLVLRFFYRSVSSFINSFTSFWDVCVCGRVGGGGFYSLLYGMGFAHH